MFNPHINPLRGHYYYPCITDNKTKRWEVKPFCKTERTSPHRYWFRRRKPNSRCISRKASKCGKGRTGLQMIQWQAIAVKGPADFITCHWNPAAYLGTPPSLQKWHKSLYFISLSRAEKKSGPSVWFVHWTSASKEKLARPPRDAVDCHYVT